jgi:hypothetical protein
LTDAVTRRGGLVIVSEYVLERKYTEKEWQERKARDGLYLLQSTKVNNDDYCFQRTATEDVLLPQHV